jgi:alpha-D-ribose 1-methylphosphonate 5-triphosphate synthase subunit PhnH
VIDGLNSNDLELLFEINSDFPLGVDTLFVDEAGRIVAIPRSTRMTD